VIRRLDSGASGRTSTAQTAATGQRAAQLSAASSDASSKNYESRQLHLGISEGTILYAPFPFLKSDRDRILRHFKGIAANVYAGVDESLVVRPPGAEVGIGFVAIPCRKASGDS
jgi:hypothetical protein